MYTNLPFVNRPCSCILPLFGVFLNHWIFIITPLKIVRLVVHFFVKKGCQQYMFVVPNLFRKEFTCLHNFHGIYNFQYFNPFPMLKYNDCWLVCIKTLRNRIVILLKIKKKSVVLMHTNPRNVISGPLLTSTRT